MTEHITILVGNRDGEDPWVEKKKFHIDKQITIGRDAKSMIRSNLSIVSRDHGELFVEKGKLWYRQNGKNSTLLLRGYSHHSIGRGEVIQSQKLDTFRVDKDRHHYFSFKVIEIKL